MTFATPHSALAHRASGRLPNRHRRRGRAAVTAVWAYTTGFGVLLLAGLLLIIFGFEALDSPFVVIVSTIMPLSLSLGSGVGISDRVANVIYLVFAVAGLTAVTLTRLFWPGKLATITLAIVHGIAGLIIFILPIVLGASQVVPWGFALVGAGRRFDRIRRAAAFLFKGGQA
jgi:hypothetical protein